MAPASRPRTLARLLSWPLLTQALTVAAMLALGWAGTACNDPFGRKYGLDYIVPPDTSPQQVAYVPVFPFLTGLDQPTEIASGFDELLYVVDRRGRGRIVSYDLSGRQLAEFSLPGVVAVAQDRTLDLLALGRDTVNTGTPAEPRFVTLATIYRISLKNARYGLEQARIVRRITHPFYFAASVSASPRATEVAFNGITVLPDNRYMVTRSGPGADLLTGTPEDAVLLFGADDRFISPLALTGADGGVTLSFFRNPFAIATLPPQGFTITAPESEDFVVSTLAPDDSVLRVRYVAVEAGPEGTSYAVRQLAAGGDTLAQDFIYRPGRFRRPMGLAIAGDETRFMFVTDAARDSVYQFTPQGLEGVQLRASQTNRRFNRVSFGGTGSGPFQFRHPQGVTYRNRNLFVCDRDNGRVCRYQLTIDFD